MRLANFGDKPSTVPQHKSSAAANRDEPSLDQLLNLAATDRGNDGATHTSTLHPRIASTSHPREKRAPPVGPQGYSVRVDRLSCRRRRWDSAKGSRSATSEPQCKPLHMPDPPATRLDQRTWRSRSGTRMSVPNRTTNSARDGAQELGNGIKDDSFILTVGRLSSFTGKR